MFAKSGARLRHRVVPLATAMSVVALVAMACAKNAEPGGVQSTETVSAALGEICQKGADQGSLTFWGQFSPEAASAMIGGFNESFPQIKVDYLALKTVDIAQRVISATSVNRPVGMDVASGAIEDFVPLTSRGLQASAIDWQKLGIPEDLVDPETTLVRLDRIPLGLVYNTDLVTNEAELPNTWEELIDPKWKGKIVVDPNGQPFKTLAVAWGVDKTLDYLNRLKNVVDPIVIQGGTAGATAVSSGEAAMVTNGREESFRELQAKGAPVGMKFLDVVPTSNDWLLVIKDGEHEAAATCFAAWVATSDRAADILMEQEFKSNETRPKTAPSSATIVSVQTEEDSEKSNAIAKAMVQLFGKS